MGRTFHFECPHCQYRARVSGGADAGVNCAVQTIFCRDCRELFEVFTRVRKRETAENSAKNSRPRNLLPQRANIPPAMLIENPWPEFQPSRPRISTRPTFLENPKIACPISKFHRVQL